MADSLNIKRLNISKLWTGLGGGSSNEPPSWRGRGYVPRISSRRTRGQRGRGPGHQGSREVSDSQSMGLARGNRGYRRFSRIPGRGGGRLPTTDEPGFDQTSNRARSGFRSKRTRGRGANRAPEENIDKPDQPIDSITIESSSNITNPTLQTRGRPRYRGPGRAHRNRGNRTSQETKVGDPTEEAAHPKKLNVKPKSGQNNAGTNRGDVQGSGSDILNDGSGTSNSQDRNIRAKITIEELDPKRPMTRAEYLSLFDDGVKNVASDLTEDGQSQDASKASKESTKASTHPKVNSFNNKMKKYYKKPKIMDKNNMQSEAFTHPRVNSLNDIKVKYTKNPTVMDQNKMQSEF